jgi:CBS domain-containing protein
MRCRELMRREVFYCRLNEPLYRVAELMAREGVGFLPVVDGLRRLVGVVTDRDLTVRGLARRLGPETPVERVMTAEVVTCRALDPLARAVELMAVNHLSHLPVVDGFGECIGVVSLSDVAREVAPAEAGKLFERISHREAPPSIH